MPKLKTESTETKTAGDLRSHNAMTMLLSTVERVERLSEEISALTEDRKEVYSEAKGMGLDTAIIRKVIARRKMDAAERQESDKVLELYEEALREAEKKQIKESEEAGT